MNRTGLQWTEGGLQRCRGVKMPLSNPDPWGERQGLYTRGTRGRSQLPCLQRLSVVSDAMFKAVWRGARRTALANEL
jgi:hypothetical protein